MKAYSLGFLNAIILIIFSTWGYFSFNTPSITALIPAIIGLLLLFCNKGVKKENKVIAHIAVVLTLPVLVGLIKPLSGAMDRGNGLAIFRVVIMLLSTIAAFLFFIKSFSDARKNKRKEKEK